MRAPADPLPSPQVEGDTVRKGQGTPQCHDGMSTYHGTEVKPQRAGRLQSLTLKGWFPWVWRLQNQDNAIWAGWEWEEQAPAHCSSHAATGSSKGTRASGGNGMELWLYEREARKT